MERLAGIHILAKFSHTKGPAREKIKDESCSRRDFKGRAAARGPAQAPPSADIRRGWRARAGSERVPARCAWRRPRTRKPAAHGGQRGCLGSTLSPGPPGPSEEKFSESREKRFPPPAPRTSIPAPTSIPAFAGADVTPSPLGGNLGSRRRSETRGRVAGGSFCPSAPAACPLAPVLNHLGSASFSRWAAWGQELGQIPRTDGGVKCGCASRVPRRPRPGPGLTPGDPEPRESAPSCRRKSGVRRRPDLGATFSRSHELCFPGGRGFDFVCLRRRREEAEGPLGRRLLFPRPLSLLSRDAR